MNKIGRATTTQQCATHGVPRSRHRGARIQWACRALESASQRFPATTLSWGCRFKNIQQLLRKMLPLHALTHVCRVLPSTLQKSAELKLDLFLQKKKAAKKKKKAFLEQNIVLKWRQWQQRQGSRTTGLCQLALTSSDTARSLTNTNWSGAHEQITGQADEGFGQVKGGAA